MKALVTGASGFLGSHLVDRLLDRGDSVRALVRPTSYISYLQERGAELVSGDITDPRSLPGAFREVDVVYHAAAMVTDWAPWRAFQQVTIEGTRNVARAAGEAGVARLLHVSTDGVYALGALRGRVTEESPLERRFGWLDYYRRSKIAAEQIVREEMAAGRLSASIVRPGLLLGERDRVMLPDVAAYLRGGSAAFLGSAANRLPYIYAGDVAEACILAATSDSAAGQTYNAASDETVTQRDLFEAVAEAVGVRLPRRRLPVRLAYVVAFGMELASVLTGRRARPSISRFGINVIALDYQEDASKARRELGWQAKVPMREAVRRCLEWTEAKRSQAVGG